MTNVTRVKTPSACCRVFTDDNQKSVTYSQDDQIGMVHPEELTQEQRAFWKRYAKKEKWKQLIPQLRLPVYNGQYDLSAFCGVQVKQIFIVTTAGKWGLYQGSIKDK